MKKNIYCSILCFLIFTSCKVKYYEYKGEFGNGCPRSTLVFKKNGTFRFSDLACYSATKESTIEGTYSIHKSVSDDLFFLLRYNSLPNLTLDSFPNFQFPANDKKLQTRNLIYFDLSPDIDILVSNKNIQTITIRLNGDSLVFLPFPNAGNFVKLELSDEVKSFKFFIGNELISDEVKVQQGQSAYSVRYFDTNPYNRKLFLETSLDLQNKDDLEFFYNQYIQDTLFLRNDTLFINEVPKFITR